MASVTQTIKQVVQPREGFIKPSDFVKTVFNDGKNLNNEENIHPSIVGMCVDYFSRFMVSNNAKDAFIISLLGAKKANEEEKAHFLVSQITGLNDKSIISACKLCGYDVCFRAGMKFFTKPVSEINPDPGTIQNIKIMVERMLHFYDKYGPVTKYGFVFPGAYTGKIDSGDGDILTSDTIWDIKVSKKPITKTQTLQILIYYIMGLHSESDDFHTIKYLGFFNPRRNESYVLSSKTITKEIIDMVAHDIIGYKVKKEIVGKEQNPRLLKNNLIQSSNETYLTTMDVAMRLNITKYYVYKYIQTGKLKATKTGNKYVVSESELLRFIEDLRQRKEAMLGFVIISGIVSLIIILALLLLLFN